MQLTTPYTFREVSRMLGGRLTVGYTPHIDAVSTDSRSLEKGAMFVALPGSSCDGSRYLSQAEHAGASCAVVSVGHFHEAEATCHLPLIVVDDTLQALQRFSHAHLAQFSDVIYAGVTGSCGKSTTKEALAAILSKKGKTAKTPGNLNSEIGLPLSVLSVDKDTRYGVFEMGVDHVGEMAHMLNVVSPDVAILTNIGISHLEKFKTQQAIAHEKGSIFHPGLKAGFIAGGSPFLSQIQQENHVILREYQAASFKASCCGLSGWDLSIGERTCHVNAVGEHLLTDIAGAVAAARFLGADEETICEGLSGFTPMTGRSTVLSGKVTIIEDCYNASLDSTRSILDCISSISWNGNKKVVLGPMKELGEASRNAHEEVARRILRSDIRSTFLYGQEMYDAYKVLKDNDWNGELSFTEDFSKLSDEVSASVRQGDLFLVKGSRAATMERLIPLIRAIG